MTHAIRIEVKKKVTGERKSGKWRPACGWGKHLYTIAGTEREFLSGQQEAHEQVSRDHQGGHNNKKRQKPTGTRVPGAQLSVRLGKGPRSHGEEQGGHQPCRGAGVLRRLVTSPSPEQLPRGTSRSS